jgi:hypothetical protein
LNPFKIKAVGAEDDHLIGSAIYREKMEQAPLKVDGTETTDGRFWPRVVAEVSNDINGEWKKLDQPANSEKPAAFSLKSYQANVMLYVHLDVFRPLIGKMRYGRVLLENGEAAVFELKDLPPSATNALSRGDIGDWDRSTLFGYLEDPLAKGPFVIAAISSKQGHLRAACGFSHSKGTSATTLEGTETSDGDFWVSVTLQVANDPDGTWKTIGESSTLGKPVTVTFAEDTDKIFYVDLDGFSPAVGKFGYGRVLLENGQSAAFELTDLLPPTEVQ